MRVPVLLTSLLVAAALAFAGARGVPAAEDSLIEGFRQAEVASVADAIEQHPAGAFLAFLALHFAVWTVLALVLYRNSERHEVAVRWSAPGLAAVMITVTMASVDWLMSLEPHWYSTIYGIIFVVGQALATLAFCTVALALLMRRTSLAEFVKPSHFHDLGNLTLAFVMLWAYVAFSQFLIIWAGNLPEETPWYVRRLNGGWGWIAGFLIIFHFLLPFALLLVRENKRRIGVLAG